MHKKIYSLLIFFVIFIPLSWGQDEEIKTDKSDSYWEVAITPQYFFNKFNIPKKYFGPTIINTKNKAGVSFDIGYQKVFRKGFVLGGGLAYNIIGHEWTHDFGDWSFYNAPQRYPELIYILDTMQNRFTVKHSAHIISIYPTFGYRFALKKSASLQVDLGIGYTFYVLNGKYKGDEKWVHFENETRDTSFYQHIYGYDAIIGATSPNSNKALGITRLRSHLNVSYYIPYKKGYIQNLSLGLKVTFAGLIHEGNGGSAFGETRLFRFSEFQSDYSYSYKNTYDPKDFSIGIKLGVGLGSLKH